MYRGCRLSCSVPIEMSSSWHSASSSCRCRRGRAPRSARRSPRSRSRPARRRLRRPWCSAPPRAAWAPPTATACCRRRDGASAKRRRALRAPSSSGRRGFAVARRRRRLRSARRRRPPACGAGSDQRRRRPRTALTALASNMPGEDMERRTREEEPRSQPTRRHAQPAGDRRADARSIREMPPRAERRRRNCRSLSDRTAVESDRKEEPRRSRCGGAGSRARRACRSARDTLDTSTARHRRCDDAQRETPRCAVARWDGVLIDDTIAHAIRPWADLLGLVWVVRHEGTIPTAGRAALDACDAVRTFARARLREEAARAERAPPREDPSSTRAGQLEFVGGGWQHVARRRRCRRSAEQLAASAIALRPATPCLAPLPSRRLADCQRSATAARRRRCTPRRPTTRSCSNRVPSTSSGCGAHERRLEFRVRRPARADDPPRTCSRARESRTKAAISRATIARAPRRRRRARKRLARRRLAPTRTARRSR